MKKYDMNYIRYIDILCLNVYNLIRFRQKIINEVLLWQNKE